MNSQYQEFIATRIRKNSDVLASRWLDSLKAIVLEDTQHIFPTEQYLDHIPLMIQEIGEIVRADDMQLALINSLISRKALELGTLRHEQDATVSQLLREYDVLALHLEDFIVAQTNEFNGHLKPVDMMNVSNAVHAIVRRVLQDTVDSFVSRYVDTIEEQTEKILYFNSFVGHEIRTPLQTALLNIEFVLEDRKHDADASETLNDVQSAIEQVIVIINNVDNLVNASDNVVADSPVTQQIGLAEIITDITDQLDHAMSVQNVRLDMPDDLGTVTTDTGKLRLILTNLLSNSIKYRDQSKPDSYIRVRREETAKGNICISIHDNGIGIPPGLLANVRDLKVRAHPADGTDNLVDGHGIGLFLVDEAVKFLHGEMTIESTEETGTTITLTIPDR